MLAHFATEAKPVLAVCRIAQFGKVGEAILPVGLIGWTLISDAVRHGQ